MTEPVPAPVPAPQPAPKPGLGAKLANVGHKLAGALLSKEARGPELALARIILTALGVKLGVNLVDYLK